MPPKKNPKKNKKTSKSLPNRPTPLTKKHYEISQIELYPPGNFVY